MNRAVRICLLLAVIEATAGAAVVPSDADRSRLAGIYIKEGNQNGQLRFLGSALNTNTNTNSNSNSNSLNAALNQYITNKQDMLEQLRPTNTNSGTGLGFISGLGTGTATGGSNSASNAIYVSLGGGSGTTGTGTGITSPTSLTSPTTGTGVANNNNQAALNQVIYGSTPINNLLPQIVGQAVAQRQGVAGNTRRGVVQRRRRIQNGGQRRRRKGNKKGKNGNKRPQVVVVRPNRG